MEKIKMLCKKGYMWGCDHFIFILFSFLLISSIASAWLLYTELKSERDFDNVNETIYDITDSNRRAENAIRYGREEVSNSIRKLKRSEQRTSEIRRTVSNASSRTETNTKIIGEVKSELDDCLRLNREAEGILNEIGKANQFASAQADGT
ncbi:hypothetical protein [Allisonella histaminiformans]|uniref:hypothetical protein n=1 Tax=Allisonella histaminiformans TaxID=209880 RepID=UPI002E772907|nr:hypothetical protein [Allisonella histaminiformans]